MPMRRRYVVPMRWMVIYEYEVPGGALNLSSTKLPRRWSPWESTLSRKNPHGRAGNRTRDLKISSQKLCSNFTMYAHYYDGYRLTLPVGSFIALKYPNEPNAHTCGGIEVGSDDSCQLK
jgi:hypothetical protein